MGGTWRSFAPARATIPAPHSTHEAPLSIYDGGAQDITSTGTNHRRRNCSPAWLLAPRSAQRRWSGGGAERFVAPFVTLRRSRTQDAERVEQLRGHTADYLLKTIGEDQQFRYFSGQCVRGDGHPVGGNRHLNDPRIYGDGFFNRRANAHPKFRMKTRMIYQFL